MHRFDIINHLIRLYGFQSYLEIGVLGCETFNQVATPVRHGVDPNGAGDFAMTSDEFFERYSMSYDLIFIDGLHLHEQAFKDVENALTHLNDGGIIVMHDCLPTEEWQQLRQGLSGKPWTGDVWKAFADLRASRKDLSMYVVDTDWGCGVIKRGSQTLVEKPAAGWTWDHFVSNKKAVMNVVTEEEFVGYSQP